MLPALPSRSRSCAAFTLVELLVSMLVLSIMLVLLTQTVGSLRDTITRTTGAVGEFQEARGAFETMTRRLSQATLNTYNDLNPLSTSIGAANYVRASELRFITGNADALTGGTNSSTDAVFFQAPLGFSSASANAPLARLLNTCGYYIQWGSDAATTPPSPASRPSCLPTTVPLRWRFRLFEMIEPSENLSIYNYTSGPDQNKPKQSASWNYTGTQWFQSPLAASPVPAHVLAENVILLALLPMVAPQNAQYPPGGDKDGTSTDLTTNYNYDTSPTVPSSGSAGSATAQNQLPPLVWVMMIAVDEKSFARYQATQGTNYPAALTMLQNGILTKADYTDRMQDVTSVTNALRANNIAYRVFTTAVPLSAH